MNKIENPETLTLFEISFCGLKNITLRCEGMNIQEFFKPFKGLGVWFVFPALSVRGEFADICNHKNGNS